jgi:hypothetical protein
MPAKYVRPYSKGQKNDFRDAEAIAEAVQRPADDRVKHEAAAIGCIALFAIQSLANLPPPIHQVDRTLALYPERINPRCLWDSANAARARMTAKNPLIERRDVRTAAFACRSSRALTRRAIANLPPLSKVFGMQAYFSIWSCWVF